MPITIIIKKYPRLFRNQSEKIGYSHLCSDEKNDYLKKRLRQRSASKNKVISNFKSNWFCNDCNNSFSLKPIKKYKTLLRFPLQCSKCKSQKISQSTNSIWSDNSIEIEYEIKNFNKYHPELLGNTMQENLPSLIITVN